MSRTRDFTGDTDAQPFVIMTAALAGWEGVMFHSNRADGLDAGSGHDAGARARTNIVRRDGDHARATTVLSQPEASFHGAPEGMCI